MALTDRVESPTTVFLNGILYKIKPPIRSFVTSQYPGKIVIGDVSGSDYPDRSRIGWKDNRGGIGAETFEGDTSRSWWSTWDTSTPGHTVLPPAYTQTASSGVTGYFSVGFIADLANFVYAGFGTSVRRYDTSSNTWSSELHSLPTIAVRSFTVRLKGIVYLIITHTTGYTYTSDGITWNDEVDDMKYLAAWHDRLWALDNTGQLKWTEDLSPATPIWTNDAQLPLEDDAAEGLITGRDTSQELILYALTRTGLWSHDARNERFIETDLSIPYHPFYSKGGARWRDALYIAAGIGVYKYQVGAGAVVSATGPDRDGGLPDDKRGRIIQLLGSHKDLLALVDATVLPDPENVNILVGGPLGSHHSASIPTELGFSHILAYDGIGWRCLWISDADTQEISYALISNAYNRYRIWWAHDERVYFLDLPTSVFNPNEDTLHEYDSRTHDHESPWITVEASEDDWLAIYLKVDTRGTSVNETVTCQFKTNWAADSSYTTLGSAITAEGVTVFDFPNSTSPSGTAFRSIRFRFRGVRGNTATNSPDIIRVEFGFIRKQDARWGHIVTVDLNDPMENDSSSEDAFANIRAAVETRSLVPFTFRARDADPLGNTNPYNYYVQVKEAHGLEFTGDDWTGEVRLTLVEP